MPVSSTWASSRATGSSTSRYSADSPLAASRAGSWAAIGSSAWAIAPAQGATRSAATPSRLGLDLPLPAIVARVGSTTPPSRCTTASPGSDSAVGSSRNAASIVSSTMPSTVTPATANDRITVLASCVTLATAGSASTAWSSARSSAVGGAGAPM